MEMQIIGGVTLYFLGLVTGIYAASQIEKQIDNNIKSRKQYAKEKKAKQ